MKLNYLKMLKDIENKVEDDFVFNMNCKRMPNSKPYTQKEAEQMADLLGSVYSISHCIHCRACQKKYLI